MSREESGLEYTLYDRERYLKDRYNIEDRVSMDDLEEIAKENLVVKVHGAGELYREGQGQAVNFAARLEFRNRLQLEPRPMGTIAVNLLAYSGVVPSDSSLVSVWPAFLFPDQGRNVPRKNGSPLVDWVFLKEDQVSFVGRGVMYGGYLSYWTDDDNERNARSLENTLSLDEIERYANQGRQ